MRLPLTLATDTDIAKADLSLHAIVNNAHCRDHVLLVQDQPANAMVAYGYLEHFGYHVDVADSGEAAFEKIKVNRYRIVLMDVQMPDLDGFGATRLIREYEKENDLPRTPIIGMTAYALSAAIVNAASNLAWTSTFQSHSRPSIYRLCSKRGRLSHWVGKSRSK